MWKSGSIAKVFVSAPGAAWKGVRHGKRIGRRVGHAQALRERRLLAPSGSAIEVYPEVS